VTILRNKVVLAMGATTQAPAGNAVTAAAGAVAGTETAVQTATLSISPAEARTLALADLNATLRLALRSPRDGTRYESGDELVFAAPAAAHFSAPASAPAPAAPVQAAVAVRKAPGIAIIDGDQFVR
jgi:Flp pilus assembly protein CpaB